MLNVYGTEITATPTSANAQYTYRFDNWTNGTATVTGNLTVTANFSRTVNTYTVTWLSGDGSAVLETDKDVPYGTKPSYDGETPTKPANAQYTYTFAGWSVSADQESGTLEENLTAIAGNTTYYAAFSKTVNKYVVTITVEPSGYGTVNHETVTEVPYGTVISASGSIATINGTSVIATEAKADAQYTYSFVNWKNGETIISGETTITVVGNATITATFTRVVNTYTITWVNYDGTELEVDENVPYGQTPAYNGEIPTKPSNAQFTYTHSGWDPAVESVKGNKTYTATFSSTVNEYTVVWKNDDGTVLETDNNVPYGTTPTYDGETPTKARTAQYTFTFADWTPTIADVTGDVIYTATYTATLNSYTVTITTAPSGYGTVNKSSVANVPYGTILSVVGSVLTINTTQATTITATETPADAQYTYKFESWTNGTETVKGDLTVIANFSRTVNKYTITWVDEDDTVLEVDKDVEYGKTPEYNGKTPTKSATAQYTYTFDDWSPEIDTVVKDATYKATYKATLNNYTVTITTSPEGYGKVDKSSVANVPYGTVLAVNGNVITINETTVTATETPADAQYTYSFVDWTNGTVEVHGDLEVVANFTRIVNTYAITWVNDDGTVLETDPAVEYGQLPKYDGATPTKERTAQFSYKFDAWSPEIVAVTCDATYTATYTSTVNNYIVTITISPEGYGTVSQDKVFDVPYGSVISATGSDISINGTHVSATETASDAQYTYSFVSWTSGQTVISGDVTLTVGGDVSIVANFTRVVNTYTITWFNDNGVVLETDTEVPYGATPSYDGDEPTKDRTAQYTYTFNGWTPEIVSVANDAIYIASFTATVNKYTITWVNEDGTVLEVDKDIEYGQLPSYDGDEPTKERTAQFSYEFSGWTPSIDIVKGDETYTAVYISHLNAYTITWVNEDGTVLEVDEFVDYGELPEYNGLTPTKEATAQYTYTFASWSPLVDVVIGDQTYTATYSSKVNTYKITWLNEDGSVLHIDEAIEYGQVPVYDGPTPTKERTAQYTYTFNVWTPEVVSVTGEATYTATYTATVNNYTVSFIVLPEGYGTVSQSTVTEVPYGTTLSVVGPVLTINTTNPTIITATETPADAQYTYKFESWTNGTATVEGNLTVMANFSRKVNGYTITWLNEDGTVLEVDEGVEYGKNPSYDGDIPTKAADVQYTYTFDKWSPDLAAVTGSATYTATYTATLNKYTVSVLDDSTGYGSVISSNGETGITVDYGTPVSISENVITIAGETFTATPKDNEGEYSYEFKNWSETITQVTGDITIIANFIRLVRISIETVGVDGNIYGVDVYNADSELINETPYTQAFRLETNKIYTIKVVSNLIADSTNNKYQILRTYIDDTYIFTQDSIQGDVDKTIFSKTELVDPMTIKIEYLSAYLLKVNLTENTISEISVTEIDDANNVVIKYSSRKGYIVAEGSELNFKVDATPASKDSVHTFIGFDYILNGTKYTIGVNGGTHVTYKSFTQSNSYPNDTDIGDYYYNVSGDYKITEITVVTVSSRVIDSINTTNMTGSLTLTSEYGFNKVVDSSTTSLILYDGTWTVVTDMSLAEVQAIFSGFSVTQNSETKVITIIIE